MKSESGHFSQEIENISHDLRTPLTVILGYLKLMKGQKRRTWRWWETIERKAKTMQRLVTDFYDLSRLSARDYEVRSLKQMVEGFLGNH